MAEGRTILRHLECATSWCTSTTSPFPPCTITCFGNPEAGTPPAVHALPVSHCFVDAGSAQAVRDRDVIERELALVQIPAGAVRLLCEAGERVALMALCLLPGAAQASLNESWEYIKERKDFGAPLAQYQGVTFPLAESATELHGAHLMGLNAALLLDQGAPAIKELSMAKAYSVQVGYRAVDRAMQTHGAMGFTNEVGLHHAWHSLRIVNVADGTNEILNRSIVQRLLKGDTEV